VSFAKALLDVADNLELTLEAASGEDAGVAANAEASFKTLVEGVQMTNSGLVKTFSQQGIEKFGEVGDTFDPNIHDAIFNMPDPSKEEGTIGQVIKRGYKMKDRVIRAAQVGTVSHP
jgi:molecular chaperone GrpE